MLPRPIATALAAGAALVLAAAVPAFAAEDLTNDRERSVTTCEQAEAPSTDHRLVCGTEDNGDETPSPSSTSTTTPTPTPTPTATSTATPEPVPTHMPAGGRGSVARSPAGVVGMLASATALVAGAGVLVRRRFVRGM